VVLGLVRELGHQPPPDLQGCPLRREGLVERRREGLWIHYRLARLDDTVLRTLVDITAHALGHVDAVAKDKDRLERSTGCCWKPARAPKALACCDAPVQ